MLFIISRGLVQLPVPFLMLSIPESLKPLYTLRRRGVCMYSTMQPLLVLSCMRGSPWGTGFVELNRYIKKLMCAVPFHVWSKTFSCIELFYLLPLMVVILALFLIWASYISFYSNMRYRTYMTFFIYDFFICVPFGYG